MCVCTMNKKAYQEMHDFIEHLKIGIYSVEVTAETIKD